MLAFAALAVACAVGAVLSPPAGRVLLSVAAVMVAAVAARDALRPVTVETSDAGITFVRTFQPAFLPWSEIEAIGVYAHRRLRALEIDAGERLLVLPARRLGADLDDVVEALREERLRLR